MFFEAFSDQLYKEAGDRADSVVEMLRNRQRRKRWLRPGAHERFVRTLPEKTAAIAPLARMAATGAIAKTVGMKSPGSMLMERVREGGVDRDTKPDKKDKPLKAGSRSYPTPQSSNVAGYRYDASARTLHVTYKSGGTYTYKNVPPSVFKALRRNKSVGKTIHKRVKSKGYDYEKTANDPVKETINLHGIPICLEWREGDKRKYYNHDPLKPKSNGSVDYDQKMKADYGYVKGVIDADGEELDVYVGPNRESEKVFVLEKMRRTDNSFDENKVMLGYDSMAEAKKSYLQHQGKDEMGKVTEMTVPVFKAKFMSAAAKAKFKKHAFWGTPSQLAAMLTLEAARRTPVGIATAIASRFAGGDARQNVGAGVGGFTGGLAGELLSGRRGRVMALSALIGGFFGHHVLKKEASGDMLAYFRDNPDKLREKQKRDKAKEKRKNSPEGRANRAAWRKRLGTMRKKADVAKRTLTIDGLTMKFECEKGDIRFKGKPHERKMLDCYGYMPGTYGKGADGECIDVYANPDLVKGDTLGPVYKVRQLKKETGEYDEDKFMVGYGSAAEAKKAFLRNMPSWAFGSMTSMSIDEFRKLVSQERKAVAA